MDKKITIFTTTIISLLLFAITGAAFLQIKGCSYFVLIACCILSVYITQNNINKITGIDFALIFILLWEMADCTFQRCYDNFLLYNSICSYFTYLSVRFLKKEISIITSLITIIPVVLLAIATQFMQYDNINALQFSSVYPFRFIVRPIGFLINIWGAIAILILSIVGYYILVSDKYFKLLYIAWLGCLTSLLLCFSRIGNYIGILLTITIIILTKHNKRKALFLGCILVYISVYVLYSSEFISSFALTGTSLQANSTVGRINVVKPVLEIISKSIFIGNGIGNYFETVDSTLFQNSMSYTSYAPNILFQLVVERGVLGFIPFMTLVVMTIKDLVKNNSRPCIYLIIALVSVILKEMTLSTIQNTAISRILFYVLMALAANNVHNCKIKNMSNIISVVLSLSCFCCFLVTFNQTKIKYNNEKALEAYKKSNYKESIIYLSKCQDIKPIAINKIILELNMKKAVDKDFHLIDKEGSNQMLLSYLCYGMLKNKNIKVTDLFAYLKQCINQYPDNALFYYLLYKEYYKAGDLNNCVLPLTEAIYLMPSLINAKEIRDALVKDKEFSKLFIKAINNKISAKDNSAKAIACKGYILFYMKNKEKSKKYLIAALKMQPNLATPYYLLSQIYETENQKEISAINKDRYILLARKGKPIDINDYSAYPIEDFIVFYCFSQKFKTMYGIDMFTKFNIK